MAEGSTIRRYLSDVDDIELSTASFDGTFTLKFCNWNQDKNRREEFLVTMSDPLIESLGFRLHEHLKRRSDQVDACLAALRKGG